MYVRNTKALTQTGLPLKKASEKLSLPNSEWRFIIPHFVAKVLHRSGASKQ